jgi:hypothetical protein
LKIFFLGQNYEFERVRPERFSLQWYVGYILATTYPGGQPPSLAESSQQQHIQFICTYASGEYVRVSLGLPQPQSKEYPLSESVYCITYTVQFNIST